MFASLGLTGSTRSAGSTRGLKDYLAAGFRLIQLGLAAIGLLAALAILGAFEVPANAESGLAGGLVARLAPQAPAADAVAEPAPELGSRMQAAADYIAKRYRVARPAVVEIVHTAEIAARAAGLDPLLVLAVIGVESGYNPLRESVMGAQGLMQIIGRFHTDKFEPTPDGQALLDPETNVRVGVSIIKEYLRRTGRIELALQYYVGAAEDEELAYATKVMAEKQRLEQAAKPTIRKS